MSRILLALAVLVLLVLVGGFVYLSSVDLPAPRERVEKVLPSDQLAPN
jgi:hypothetical protein